MLRFVVICAALLTVALGEILQGGFNGRIVNGVNTTITKHPYQVSLQSIQRGHFCGGSIINKNTIVTAAHCLYYYNISEMRVRLGSTDSTKGGVYVEVTSSLVHPKYDNENNVYDVGLYKLAQNVAESANIRYIELAEVAPKDGTPAVVTGWGTACYNCTVNPPILQMVEVSIVSEKECASDKYKYGPKLILDTMICAYEVDKDACQGDSGGPLVADSKMVGLVSWGQDCAERGYPGVYADVAALRSWIVENSA